MPPLVRSVMAVMAGVLAGFFHIAAVETLGLILFPLPPGIDPTRPESIAAHPELIPTGAMLMVLLAYVAGAFAGSWLAARLAPAPRTNHGLAVGALLLIATIANLRLIPHPAWFWAVSLTLIPAASYLGARWGSTRIKPAPLATDPGGLPS